MIRSERAFSMLESFRMTSCIGLGDSADSLVSSAATNAALVGMPLTSREFERSERWPAYRFPFTSTALAVVLFMSLAVFRVGLNSWWAGVAQRQFPLFLTGWIVFHAARLYHLTGGSRE